MSASLCIQIYSIPNIDERKEEIDFFEDERWDENTEKLLTNRLQELLVKIRPMGLKLHLEVNVEVADIDAVTRLLNGELKRKKKKTRTKLSIRELEVLNLIMQGFTSREIADQLFVCYETIKSHRKNILEKTGAKNTASLINYYHQTFFDK